MLRSLDRDALPLPDGPATDPPQCVPERYQGPDLVDAYGRTTPPRSRGRSGTTRLCPTGSTTTGSTLPPDAEAVLALG